MNFDYLSAIRQEQDFSMIACLDEVSSLCNRVCDVGFWAAHIQGPPETSKTDMLAHPQPS
jgi:hypothetical protein